EIYDYSSTNSLKSLVNLLVACLTQTPTTTLSIIVDHHAITPFPSREPPQSILPMSFYPKYPNSICPTITTNHQPLTFNHHDAHAVASRHVTIPYLA
ncbi:hypothetical protein KSS87_009750, partial [Heliosperma pusillum]